jgi:hypothetical protein
MGPDPYAQSGPMAVYAERLDDVVHYLAVRGLPADGELEAAIDGALAARARWLIVNLEGARLEGVGEALLAAAGHVLRARRGELILVSSSTAVADRVSRYEVGNRPALAATVDQALIIMEMLRPKAAIQRPSPV